MFTTKSLILRTLFPTSTRNDNQFILLGGYNDTIAADHVEESRQLITFRAKFYLSYAVLKSLDREICDGRGDIGTRQ